MLRNQKMENEAKKKLGVDALSVSDYNIFSPRYKPRFLNEDTHIDLFGKVYRVRRDVRTTRWVDGEIKTPEDLERWNPPDPEEMDYSIVDLTVKEAGDMYPVVAWVHGSMMFPYLMCGGIDEPVYSIYRRPDFARDLIQKVADVNFEITKRILDRGVDMVAKTMT